MTSQSFNFGENIPVRTRFEDLNGAGITNATGEVFIQRTSDNQYFNGATFQVARLSIAMTEIDETNSAGVWEFIFNTNLGLAIDGYTFEAVDTSGNSVGIKGIFSADVGRYLEQLLLDSSKVLGLMHENATVNPVYDGNDNLISAIVTQYNSKANAELDDGSTGFVRKWSIASPHTGITFDKFTLVLEP